jgi:hypothetical protein
MCDDFHRSAIAGLKEDLSAYNDFRRPGESGVRLRRLSVPLRILSVFRITSACGLFFYGSGTDPVPGRASTLPFYLPRLTVILSDILIVRMSERGSKIVRKMLERVCALFFLSNFPLKASFPPFCLTAGHNKIRAPVLRQEARRISKKTAGMRLFADLVARHKKVGRQTCEEHRSH